MNRFTKAKKTIFFLLIFLALAPVLFNQGIRAKELQLSARAAILMEVSSGQVLYAKNSDLQLPPASTTKIMTGILAIELGDLSSEVKVSPLAAAQEGSSIWLTAGEVLTLKELIYGLLLSSGNDAAFAIAEHIGGTVENFAELMNLKARQLGALNTHFVNPHGLPDPKHLTTARDLAIITRYALHNPFFSRVVATKHTTISWPGKEWARGLRNHNKLLWLYSGADGVKTGYTRAAGRCLVTSATRNGRRLIAVVLNSPQHYSDCRKLLDYGFEEYSREELVRPGEVVRVLETKGRGNPVKVVAGAGFDWAIPGDSVLKVKKEIILEQNILNKAGQRAGLMKIYIEGEQKGVVPLILET